MSDTQDAPDHAAVDLWRNLAEAERARADRLAAALLELMRAEEGTAALALLAPAPMVDAAAERVNVAWDDARAALADVRVPPADTSSEQVRAAMEFALATLTHKRIDGDSSMIASAVMRLRDALSLADVPQRTTTHAAEMRRTGPVVEALTEA